MVPTKAGWILSHLEPDAASVKESEVQAVTAQPGGRGLWALVSRDYDGPAPEFGEADPVRPSAGRRTPIPPVRPGGGPTT